MPRDSREASDEPFGRALRDLLLDRDEYLTTTGNVSWSTFARDIPGIHYETLRKAAAGERQPTIELMERCATVLGVPPSYFLEYRLWEARRMFDPSEVGLDQAAENVRRWMSGETG